MVTLEFWSRELFANDDDLAFEYTPNYNSNQGGLLVDPNDASGKFDIAHRQGLSGGYNVFATTRPSAAAWHHYALVFDRSATAVSELKAYVDGATVSSTSAVGTDALGNFANSTLYFMSRAGSSLFGAGDLDEVAVYNRALTPTEVSNHRYLGTGETPPPPPPPDTTPPDTTIS